MAEQHLEDCGQLLFPRLRQHPQCDVHHLQVCSRGHEPGSAMSGVPLQTKPTALCI